MDYNYIYNLYELHSKFNFINTEIDNIKKKILDDIIVYSSAYLYSLNYYTAPENNITRKDFCDIGTTYKYRDRINNETRCIICFENYLDNEIIKKLPCNHDYHLDCLSNWMLNKCGNCPICKHKYY